MFVALFKVTKLAVLIIKFAACRELSADCEILPLVSIVSESRLIEPSVSSDPIDWVTLAVAPLSVMLAAAL